MPFFQEIHEAMVGLDVDFHRNNGKLNLRFSLVGETPWKYNYFNYLQHIYKIVIRL